MTLRKRRAFKAETYIKNDKKVIYLLLFRTLKLMCIETQTLMRKQYQN